MHINDRTPLLHTTGNSDQYPSSYVTISSEQPADLTVTLGAQYAAQAAPLAGAVCTADGVSVYYELHGLLDGYGGFSELGQSAAKQLVT